MRTETRRATLLRGAPLALFVAWTPIFSRDSLLPTPTSPPLSETDIARLLRKKQEQEEIAHKKIRLRDIILSVKPIEKATSPTIEENPITKDLIDTIKLVDEMMRTMNPRMEDAIFSRCDTPLKREAVLPFIMNQPIRQQALETVWQGIVQNANTQGLVMRDKVQALCEQGKVRRSGISLHAMHAALLAVRELDQEESIYQKLKPHQIPSPLILAGIAQIETAGGKNFGSIPLNHVVPRRTLDNDYIPHLTNMNPQGVPLPLYPNEVFSSTGGAIGIPQVVGNTLKNIKERRDGSKLNMFDMFEGMLAIAYILVAKGWDNQSREKSRNAFGEYGAWAYVNEFDNFWKAAQTHAQLLKEPLFVRG